MIDKRRMAALALGAGIELNGGQLNQLDGYAELLADWNTRMNLTAITEPAEMEQKHFLDCLHLAALPELRGSLVDVGSGAGFPGAVVKLYRPHLEVTLMEPTGKRQAFLAELGTRLGLDWQAVKERAEEAARKGWRESFDVAVARAVAGLPRLCEYCLPLVRPEGLFVAMKAVAGEELAQAQNAMQRLGGKYERTVEYVLPDGSARSLLLVRKVAATPKQYPRGGGAIAKRPL